MENKENTILPFPKSPEDETEKNKINQSEQDEAAAEGEKIKRGLESMIKDLAKRPSEGLKEDPEDEEKEEAESEDKVDSEAKTKPEEKPKAKPEEKPEEKAEKKSEEKPEEKAEKKPEEKPEEKAEKKSEEKTEVKTEAKPEEKTEVKPEETPETKPKKGLLQKLGLGSLFKTKTEEKDDLDEDADEEADEEADAPAEPGEEKKTPRGLLKALMRDPSKVFGKNADSEDEEDLEDSIAEKQEIETQLAIVKKKIGDTIQKNRLVVLLGGILILVFLLYYMIHSQTYDKISVLQTTTINGAVNCNYAEFEDGVIKYSQDGLAFLSMDGSEKWNQPYQIANPFVEMNEKIGAVADKNGTSIVVFQKTGVLGQIETNLPIERVSVSKQGIVCAILQNGDSAMVICYDCVGNVLVEHKSSFAGTGYPLDIALSDDGETLMVDYLYAADGIITTHVAFYNFGEAGQNIADHMVADFKYPGTISASCFYMNKTTCVVVGDDKLIYFNGSDEPKELLVVELEKEIKNLSYDDSTIGLVLKNDKDSGYEARMYDISGDLIMNADFTGEYGNLKVSEEQLIMYDGKQCGVILKNGVQKFKGEMENPVLEMIPQSGVNRYLLLDVDGIKKIRFVK